MISNQVLQTTIDGLRSIARVELCVVDVDGKMIATTSEEMSNCLGAAQDFSRSPADSQEVQDTSSLRYWMKHSWNISLLSEAPAKMFI